jgi:hypothetical protein
LRVSPNAQQPTRLHALSGSRRAPGFGSFALGIVHWPIELGHWTISMIEVIGFFGAMFRARGAMKQFFGPTKPFSISTQNSGNGRALPLRAHKGGHRWTNHRRQSKCES